MTSTWYRIDSADRPDADIIAAGSRRHVWADGTVESAGLSVMESIEELVDYLLAPEHMMRELIYGAGDDGQELHLVVLRGEIVGADEDGCPLLRPERIVSRTPLTRDELFGPESDPYELTARLVAATR
jgi:hypothetical protein